MPRVRAFLRALAFILLSWPASVQAGQASCAMAPPAPGDAVAMQRLIASAPVVFVGTVLSASQAGRLAEVHVEQVWNGPDLPQTVEARGGPGASMPNGGSSIDRTYEAGRRYLFFPTNGSPPFDDNQCSATMLYTPDLARYAPTTARPTNLPAPSTSQGPQERRTGTSTSAGMSRAAYFVSGAALVAVVAFGVVMLARANRLP